MNNNATPPKGVILITGASSGVGEAVARSMVELIKSAADQSGGHELVLLGRSAQKLTELQAELRGDMSPVTAYAGDITDVGYLGSVLSPIIAMGKRLSVVVHCAGMGRFGKHDEVKLGDIDEMIATNILGTAVLLQSVIPVMKEARAGHLVVVTSDVARRPLEEGAIYSASKYAQSSMVASIRKEVQPFGIRVSEVLPGLIDTNFHAEPAGSPAHHDWLQPTDVAWWIQAVVCAPQHVVVDEVMIHPLSQRY
jgi:NADP-dependent 3-hydroxy acid dehydrogenase YdfG